MYIGVRCSVLCVCAALKERGLDIQGNAKALTQRLVDYEEAR
jgi:hypothetical protein